jgi:hypothetical protein
MTEEINKRVERHDRDLAQGVVPVVDAHEEKLRKLQAHLRRPITAREANGAVRLNGDALRRHADLDNNAHEHPMVAIRRRLREERESA